jgi:hypothetical protein
MAKSGASKRPKLVPVSEDMKRISVLLAQELLDWPDVKVRPMFGLRAFYRGRVVFAMLPEKRALENPKAIAYKLTAATQTREGQQWQLFELEGERDIASALGCLERAYQSAADVPAKSRSRRT